jgi:hypothetical protein
VVKTGTTPVLEGAEWRKLLDSIPATTIRDLRDRVLIATLTYSFARISVALKMKVEDLRPRGAGWTVRLHEKGGKQHSMPCHHALAEALRAYIDAAGIVEDRKGWLFRTSRGHNGSALSDKPMSQPDAWRMIRRRAAAAGIAEAIGCHTFRATGITAYLSNGGALEHTRNGCPREPANDQALRSHERTPHPGRGRADSIVNRGSAANPGIGTKADLELPVRISAVARGFRIFQVFPPSTRKLGTGTLDPISVTSHRRDPSRKRPLAATHRGRHRVHCSRSDWSSPEWRERRRSTVKRTADDLVRKPFKPVVIVCNLVLLL